eukprot:gene29728-biopygen50990
MIIGGGGQRVGAPYAAADGRVHALTEDNVREVHSGIRTHNSATWPTRSPPSAASRGALGEQWPAAGGVRMMRLYKFFADRAMHFFDRRCRTHSGGGGRRFILPAHQWRRPDGKAASLAYGFHCEAVSLWWRAHGAGCAAVWVIEDDRPQAERRVRRGCNGYGNVPATEQHKEPLQCRAPPLGRTKVTDTCPACIDFTFSLLYPPDSGDLVTHRWAPRHHSWHWRGAKSAGFEACCPGLKDQLFSRAGLEQFRFQDLYSSFGFLITHSPSPTRVLYANRSPMCSARSVPSRSRRRRQRDGVAISLHATAPAAATASRADTSAALQRCTSGAPQWHCMNVYR